jgi:hypothetical protein
MIRGVHPFYNNDEWKIYNYDNVDKIQIVILRINDNDAM